jgi:PAS domain S-box-containing protein
MSRLATPASAIPPVSLRALIDGAPEALLVCDARGVVLLCNRAATRLLGCEAGMPVSQLEPVFGPAFLNWLQRQRRAGPRGSEEPAPRLVDGRRLQAGVQALELGQWALRLQVAREDAGASAADALGAAPMTRELLQFFWDSAFAATLQDHNHRFVAVNPAMVELTGYAADQLIGRDPLDLLPAADRAAADAFRRTEPPAGEPSRVVEQRLIDASGRVRWFVRVSRRFQDNGSPMLLSVLQDTTAEHAAREHAERTGLELDDWLDLSPLGMVLFDDAGLVLRSNRAFEALVGEVPAMLGDAPPALQALLGWDDQGPSAELQPDAAPLEHRVTLHVTDGRRLRLRARLRAIEAGPRQRRYMAVVEDRSLEEERELQQIEIGALMDTASIGIATFEESRGWVRSAQAKPAATAATGKGQSPGLQSIGRDLVDPASMPEYDRLQRALKQGERAEVRYAVRHPELGLRWLLTRVEPGQLASGRRTTSLVTLDVTDQEQAHARGEQLLRELSTILDSSNAGIAYLRGHTLVRCNQRFERMLGLPAEQAAGRTLQLLFADQPVVLPALINSLAALQSARVFETEFQVQARSDGTQSPFDAWYSLSVRRAEAAGPEVEAVAVLTDISRLKSQQAELENLGRERELMFNLSDVGIAHLRNGHVERANKALATMTGYAPAELLQLEHAELFEDRAAYLEYRTQEERMLRQQGRYGIERRLRRRDGSGLWVQVTKRLVDEADIGAGVICSYVNVDERRRAREELVLQAERTRAILDSVLVGIVTVGEHGIEWMNRSARRMFGGELADFVGEPISTVATPEPDHPLRRTHYLHTLTEGLAEAFECRLMARDGREFWVVGNAVMTGRDANNRQLTFALLDIERRRQAEVSIAQTQASLQRIIETAPLSIGLIDARSLRFTQLNQMAAATFAGSSLEAAVGRAPEELFDPLFADELVRDMRHALGSPETTRREYRRIGPNGELRVWDARYVPLVSGSEAEQLLLVASDVTEQRAADEARLEAAIAQRDMLVKEVHHRIKNNLQGVAGLMQQIAVRKPEVASVIAEAVGQVQAIAQVYGLQVGAGGPLRIQSVLEAITASVQRSFGRPLQVQVLGEAPQRWLLPEAESIPIALTLNELLTNAFKHGIGEVRCSLDCGEAEVRITIANTGSLPAGFSLARVPGGVSGLGLVRALLPRRNATLTIEAAGDEVVAQVVLVPPGVTWSESR